MSPVRLGALVRPGPLVGLAPAGLDVTVLDLRGGGPLGSPPTGPWLAWLPDEGRLPEVVAAGAQGALVGAQLVEPSGRRGAYDVRVVDGVAAARAAVGADLVLHDLEQVLAPVLAGLAAGRPAPAEVAPRLPLVLLSGMLGSAGLWDDVAALLGDVVRPVPARTDLDDTVGELAASVLAEAPPRFALAGHSLGGTVALEVVRQAPERVARLVLVASSARAPVPGQRSAWDGWRRRTEQGGFGQVAAELARATLPAARRDDARLIARGEEMAARVGPNGFLRQLAAQQSRTDALPLLAGVGVPVLVVSGGLDEVCPPDRQADMAQACPGATHVTLAEAGHMVPLEDPAGLAGAVRAWLGAQ